MNSIRSLVSELLLSEVYKKPPNFQWKFDPTVVEDGFDPERWKQMWTGVEEIDGYFFRVIIDPIDVSNTISTNDKWIDVIARAISTEEPLGGTDVTHVVTVDYEPDSKQIKLLSQIGDDLRSLIHEQIADGVWGVTLEANADFNERHLWYSGRWVVPGLDHRVPGDKLDLGLFSFVVSRDKIYLIARDQFSLQGPIRGWIYKKKSKDVRANMRGEVEQLVTKDADLLHDPDYLGELWKWLSSDGRLTELV